MTKNTLEKENAISKGRKSTGLWTNLCAKVKIKKLKKNSELETQIYNSGKKMPECLMVIITIMMMIIIE